MDIRRKHRRSLGALRGVTGPKLRAGVGCTVPVTNVHYSSSDSSFGPATFDCEVVTYDLGPFSYGVDREGPTRSICYQIEGDWGPYLVDSLVGVGNFSNPILSAPAPHAYPDNPNVICLGATLHTLVGGAQPGKFAQTAKLAKIAAHYGKHVWDPIGIEWAPLLGMTVPWTYVTIQHGYELHSVSNVANLAGETLKQVRVAVPFTTYNFRRSMIPDFVDYDGIASGLVGKVNSGTWFGKAAETVRFESYDLEEQERDPGGARVFTFSGLWKWRPVSWNYELRVGFVRTWSKIQDFQTPPQAPYDTVSFLPILQYGLI
jgi:hypothetical protein